MARLASAFRAGSDGVPVSGRRGGRAGGWQAFRCVGWL